MAPTIMKSLLLFSTTALAASGTYPVTPHEQYSSSIGALGCFINTDRIAYWPASPSCNDICVRLTHEGRSLNLLRVDQSGGAHDVSYDAWNTLVTGQSATVNPTAGGAIDMQWEDVPASECADLLHTDGNRLPLSGANSMNFLASCLDSPGSWVAGNYVLYNIVDPLCQYGYDETCTLDYPAQNQATCPHQLGVTAPLGLPVYNVQYPTGKRYNAATGAFVKRSVREREAQE